MTRTFIHSFTPAAASPITGSTVDLEVSEIEESTLHYFAATIVENKFLCGVLEFIRTKQLEEPLPKRKARGVRNPGQLPSIFKVG